MGIKTRAGLSVRRLKQRVQTRPNRL